MKRNVKIPLLAMFVLVLALFLGACNSGPAEPDIVVEDIWARQSPKAATNGAAYMIIKNNGKEADALIGAKADISKVIELHETVIDDKGVMHMNPVENQRLEIPAKGEVVLKPGGYHVMFMGLNQQLKPDDTIHLILVFEKSGEKAFDVKVRAMKGMGGMEEATKEGS
jgi:copper(I)-binding protein